MDWWHELGRVPKRRSRPLIVMRAMGPADFVFDVLDTEGQDLPQSAFYFPVIGAMTRALLDHYLRKVRRRGILIDWMDTGDASAGSITEIPSVLDPVNARDYIITLNRSHLPEQLFVTLCYELAHLFLGHLGPDLRLKFPSRIRPSHALGEVEAETVTYIVSRRNGIRPRSESYLEKFKGDFASMDFHAVTRAANVIETLSRRPASGFHLSG